MPSVAAAGQAEAGEEEGEKEGKESVTGRDRVAVYNSLSLATCTTHTFSWVLQIAYRVAVYNSLSLATCTTHTFSWVLQIAYIKAGVQWYSLQLGKRGGPQSHKL